MTEKERIELLIQLAKLEAEERRKNKSVVDSASDLVVDVIEAPFKIVGRLFDDLLP